MASEYEDPVWKTNKKTGRAFPVGGRDSMADIDPDAVVKEQFRRRYGHPPTPWELSEFKSKLNAELLGEEEKELQALEEGQIEKMSTAQMDRIIRKAEGDGGQLTQQMAGPVGNENPTQPSPDSETGGQPIFGEGESIFGEGQPIFGPENAPTKQAPDDEEIAKQASEYFEDKIVNATSQEEINGWKQDIANDSRLLQGEKAKLLKYADTQQELLDLQHSEVDIAEEIHKGVKERREGEEKAEKEKKESEDRSIFGGGEPLFGNTPLMGESESKTHTKKKKKEKTKGIFGNEPLF